MTRGNFKCTKCDRTFAMAAHLARHDSASHGGRKKKTVAKKKVGRPPKLAKKAGRPPKLAKKRRGRPKKRGARRVGRPRGVVSRLGLHSMGLDDLRQVIGAAREEARRKLAELEAAIG